MKSTANKGDIATLGMNIICMTMIFFKDTMDSNVYILRIVASMASVLLWTQLFFWLRLFDSSAQYVDLIVDTLLDISDFTKMLLLLLIMFSSGFTIIQFNRMENSLDPVFPYHDDTGFNLFMQAVLFQYKMLLGDFEEAILHRSFTGYDTTMRAAVTFENFLITFYFIGTTLFT